MKTHTFGKTLCAVLLVFSLAIPLLFAVGCGEKCDHDALTYTPTAPVCLADGTEEALCPVCGQTVTRPVAATGHTFDGKGVCTGCGAAPLYDFDATETGGAFRAVLTDLTLTNNTCEFPDGGTWKNRPTGTKTEFTSMTMEWDTESGIGNVTAEMNVWEDTGTDPVAASMEAVSDGKTVYTATSANGQTVYGESTPEEFYGEQGIPSLAFWENLFGTLSEDLGAVAKDDPDAARLLGYFLYGNLFRVTYENDATVVAFDNKRAGKILGDLCDGVAFGTILSTYFSQEDIDALHDLVDTITQGMDGDGVLVSLFLHAVGDETDDMWESFCELTLAPNLAPEYDPYFMIKCDMIRQSLGNLSLTLTADGEGNLRSADITFKKFLLFEDLESVQITYNGESIHTGPYQFTLLPTQTSQDDIRDTAVSGKVTVTWIDAPADPTEKAEEIRGYLAVPEPRDMLTCLLSETEAAVYLEGKIGYSKITTGKSSQKAEPGTARYFLTKRTLTADFEEDRYYKQVIRDDESGYLVYRLTFNASGMDEEYDLVVNASTGETISQSLLRQTRKSDVKIPFRFIYDPATGNFFDYTEPPAED